MESSSKSRLIDFWQAYDTPQKNVLLKAMNYIWSYILYSIWAY